MRTRPEPERGEVLLSVRDLHVHFALRGGGLSRLLGRGGAAVRAVDGVSFDLRCGEVLGLVGESGSGKSTLGRALLGLVPATSGSVRLGGEEITGRSERAMRPLRRRVQMVFQDPHASLNPSMDVETAVGHPLRIHRIGADADDRHRLVVAALERVGLSPASRYLAKLPGDLSGGQKQRAVLARAAILDPELLVADEPVSMLDMSVRAKILQLLLDLRRDLDLTYVYITHDLASAKYVCDRIAIMYLGRIVEIGSTEEVFARPRHPYTRALLESVPDITRTEAPAGLPRGEVPDAARPPTGCSFHPRCPRAFGPCGWEPRDLRALLEQRWLEVDPVEYERERAVLGDLSALDADGPEVVLRPGGGAAPGDVARVLASVRVAHPDEPLWRGVSAVEERADGVRVSFNAGVDPALLADGEAAVACHLHDPRLHPELQHGYGAG